jgi:hypothetical protein
VTPYELGFSVVHTKVEQFEVHINQLYCTPQFVLTCCSNQNVVALYNNEDLFSVYSFEDMLDDIILNKDLLETRDLQSLRGTRATLDIRHLSEVQLNVQ